MSEIIASTYEIIGELGSGGGGTVYLANHMRLDKRVVLKADKRNINTRAVLLRREVDVLKELSHTYIPQVYDYFIEDDISYTVMDFVDGESLDKVLKREKKFPQAVTIKWAKQLLEALSYLHSPIHGDPPRGYIHSDIKPGNIMLRPNGDVCLIDFNISLAIGIENVIGKSDGYSSPEHYGLDYSFGGQVIKDDITEVQDDDRTILQGEETELSETAASNSKGWSSSVKRVIVPDARSDIYSLGATLYHLLSGKRPYKDATGVEPLSAKEFSQPIVDIITKAMNPNPDLRFSSADEMLKAFQDLWKNDIRVKRQKKQIIAAGSVMLVLLAAGGATVFTGMKQMERLQAAYVLAADSSEALSRGDVGKALDYALEALVDKPALFDIPYTADAQLALTNALGVYDLSDSFKPYSTIELSSAPFKIIKSPDESKIIACYAYEIAVYNIESGELIKALPTLESALCEVEFISEDIILYAGAEGLTAYDISSDAVLWQAEPATAIAVSGDKTMAAAVYRNEDIINFYDTETGKIISTRQLDGKHFNIPENDKFANSERDVFELNNDGSMCAVSLNGGYLGIMDIYNMYNDLIIYESSDYSLFNGVFKDNIFAFSAAGSNGSVFAMVDYAGGVYLGEMSGNSVFGIKLYNDKLYISQNDTAVMIDTETFEQTEIAYTENKNITAFDISDNYAVSAADDGYSVFYRGAGILQSEQRDVSPDFVIATDEYIAMANRNSSAIEILKLKNYGDACIMSYDPQIGHNEARLSTDHSSVMLFSIDNFTILNGDGTIRASVEIPESDKIYDQQYRHDGDYLEVTYYSGKVVCYSAVNGDIISESEIAPPDTSLDEEFDTEKLIIKSPLHGIPAAYDKNTGEKIAELNNEDYLTYITETEKYIIAQYISTQGKSYGILMNKECEPIAQIPYLCDVINDMLIYDFPSGNIKISPIYSLEELKEMAYTKQQ